MIRKGTFTHTNDVFCFVFYSEKYSCPFFSERETGDMSQGGKLSISNLHLFSVLMLEIMSQKFRLEWLLSFWRAAVISFNLQSQEHEFPFQNGTKKQQNSSTETSEN